MIKVIVNSIVTGIVNPMPLFLLLFSAILSSHFSQNVFALVSINFFTIYNMDEPALHNDYVTSSFIYKCNQLLLLM